MAAIGATALASAVGAGPVPPRETLAQALHGATEAKPVEGVSAQIQYTNRLLEGASLAGAAGASGLASSPLLTGAGGRLWIARDGRVRLELQSASGDTEILLDHGVLSAYVPTSNTLYRFKLHGHRPGAESTGGALGLPGAVATNGATQTTPKFTPEHRARPLDAATGHRAPTLAQIEEGLARAERHAVLSGAEPGNIAGQPAYTARISPKEGGSLLGGLELSWDAVHGIPLRAALYSTTSSAPVVELAATEISYEPVEASVFELGTPPGAKIVEPGAARGATGGATAGSGPSGPAKGRHGGERPKVTTIGHGIGSILVLESRGATGTAGKPASSPLQGTQKVDINGVLANELPTALGTILTFERDGISYVVAGSRPASAIEAAARGL